MPSVGHKTFKYFPNNYLPNCEYALCFETYPQKDQYTLPIWHVLFQIETL